MHNKTKLSFRAFPNKILLSFFLLFSASLLLLSCEDPTLAPYQIRDVRDLLNTGNLPAKSGLDIYQPALREALGPIVGDQPRKLGVVYVTVEGGRDLPNDGRTWETAYPASKLKIAIDEAGAAAKPENPYLVLVGFGTYSIADIGTLSMKNNVAIVGGLAQNGSLSKKAKVIFDGGGKTQVFYNLGLDRTAALYGVTITNGQASGGGGMYNVRSSPSLTQLVFSYNTADDYGGAMRSNTGSPKLRKVTFSHNISNGRGGGGLYLDGNTTADLKQVVFFSNAANAGGGMYLEVASASLAQVIFSHNTSEGSGGGIYFGNGTPSSIKMRQVVFSHNTAKNNGGGIYFGYGGSLSATQTTFFRNTATLGGGLYSENESNNLPISNSIFWENTTSQIYLANGSYTMRMSIHNSIGATLTYQKPPATAGAAVENTVLSLSGNSTANPQLKDYSFDLFPGARVTVPAIQAGSPAIDAGLYVRENSGAYYYSTDASSWYTGLDNNGLAGTATALPSTAIDLTASDITGYARTNRPDIGAFEFR